MEVAGTCRPEESKFKGNKTQKLTMKQTEGQPSSGSSKEVNSNLSSIQLGVAQIEQLSAFVQVYEAQLQVLPPKALGHCVGASRRGCVERILENGTPSSLLL
jgi:hypothetical protein